MQTNNLLDSWVVVPAILDQHKDCTLATAWVYSYMLCKYQWFKSKKQEYFESQTEISKSARVSHASVKLAIKYLKDKALIEVSKKKGSMHYNNQYVVKDVYGVYSKLNKPAPTLPSQDTRKPYYEPPNRRLFIEELEDMDQPPF